MDVSRSIISLHRRHSDTTVSANFVKQHQPRGYCNVNLLTMYEQRNKVNPYPNPFKYRNRIGFPLTLLCFHANSSKCQLLNSLKVIWENSEQTHEKTSRHFKIVLVRFCLISLSLSFTIYLNQDKLLAGGGKEEGGGQCLKYNRLFFFESLIQLKITSRKISC